MKTGLSEVIGSWKIIAISLPRIFRIWRGGQVEQVLAVVEDLAFHDRPGGCGMSRMIESAVTALAAARLAHDARASRPC